MWAIPEESRLPWTHYQYWWNIYWNSSNQYLAHSNQPQRRSFFGYVFMLPKFISFFADLAKPLHRLLEATQQFKWTPEAEQVFQELKEKLTIAPILGYPLSEASFILDTDASNYAVGATLSQHQGAVERVIAYYSQTLSRPQRKYCVTRRKLFAVNQGRTLPPLPLWPLFHCENRSCSSEVVTQLPQPRRPDGSMDPKIAAVWFWNSASSRIKAQQCWCLVQATVLLSSLQALWSFGIHG